MTDTDIKVNDFLVNIYNHVLKQEENFISSHINDQITLNEIHVLDAVNTISQKGSATMGDVSKKLRISLGSLTVSSNRLIKKGYLCKKSSDVDKRIKQLELTKEGEKVLEVHYLWHKNLISDVKNFLSEEDYNILGNTLSKLAVFFEEKENNE